MKAYRSIAQLGQNATAESLKMWQKIHKSHRGIHLAEIAELQLEAGMVIGAQSERTLKKLATQKENNEWSKQFNERSEKRRLHMLRKVVNKRLHNKLKSKDRKRKFMIKNPDYKIKRVKKNKDVLS